MDRLVLLQPSDQATTANWIGSVRWASFYKPFVVVLSSTYTTTVLTLSSTTGESRINERTECNHSCFMLGSGGESAATESATRMAGCVWKCNGSVRIISEPPTTPPSGLLPGGWRADSTRCSCCHISTFNLNQAKRTSVSIPFTRRPPMDAIGRRTVLPVRGKQVLQHSVDQVIYLYKQDCSSRDSTADVCVVRRVCSEL